VFLAASEDEPLVQQTKKRSAREAPLIELTYNWDTRITAKHAISATSPRRRRYLRHLREADEGGDHDQSAAAGRQHGIRVLAGPPSDRAAAERFAAAAETAVGFGAEYGEMVSPGSGEVGWVER